jgi:outer membrane protein TolC
MKPHHLQLTWPIVLAIAATSGSGCTGFSRDGGFDKVARIAQQELKADVHWVRTPEEQKLVDTRISEVLRQPLSADDAVQIALLNNRGLQASIQELGISEAELVLASQLPNPHLTVKRLTAGGQYSAEQTLTFNVLSLFLVPQARAAQKRHFEQVQKSVANDVLRLAHQTRKAFYNALAAGESLRYSQQIKSAAEASAELARRMVAAGNWNRLDRAREQSFSADASVALARAALAEATAREDLTQFMGLWGEQTQFELAEHLPDLPPSIEDLPRLEQLALSTRIDLQTMRAEARALAKTLGLPRAATIIDSLEIGPTRAGDGPSADPFKKGFELGVDVPLLNGSSARSRKARATFMQAVDRLTHAAVNARSDVRKAHAKYLATYDIAKRQRDEIVPIHKAIAEENQLRYNNMLASAFDLLADARAQINAVSESIQSSRDFWIAKSELDATLLGVPP